jgi:aspartate 1-decarboxylase
VERGDKLILASYGEVPEERLADYRPRVVLVGEDNRIEQIKHSERAGARVG